MTSIKKTTLASSLITGALFLTSFICKNENAFKKDITKADEKGFAVLELFTSEGCSSCPPADELMAKIQQEAKGKPVYLLAYHVDYWDRQGWKDVFSNAAFSERQTQYGNWFNLSSIYTPQLVINGRSEFVGSAEQQIRSAIVTQLETTPVATLSLQGLQDGSKLTIQYQSAKVAKGSRLLIATIQKTAQTKVMRGENAGHTLSHVQIVRQFQNEPLSANGNGNSVVTLPKVFNTNDWEVLGFIQDQKNGQILAADRVNVNTVKE